MSSTFLLQYGFFIFNGICLRVPNLFFIIVYILDIFPTSALKLKIWISSERFSHPYLVYSLVLFFKILLHRVLNAGTVCLKVHAVERTPSMSELNEILLGQVSMLMLSTFISFSENSHWSRWILMENRAEYFIIDINFLFYFFSFSSDDDLSLHAVVLQEHLKQSDLSFVFRLQVNHEAP